MKNCTSLFLLLALSMCAHAHIFTNKNGRTLEASITRADKTHVWLKVPTGKTSKVSRDKLSDADQPVIDKWINDLLPDIRVTPKMKRGLKPWKKKPWQWRQTFKLSVEFSNYSANKELEDTEVICFLVGRSKKDKKICKILSRRTKSISILPNGSTSVVFDEIENFFSDKRGFHGLSYVLHVKRKRDGSELHLSSPNAFLKKRQNEIVFLKEGSVTKEDFLTVVKE